MFHMARMPLIVSAVRLFFLFFLSCTSCLSASLSLASCDLLQCIRIKYCLSTTVYVKVFRHKGDYFENCVNIDCHPSPDYKTYKRGPLIYYIELSHFVSRSRNGLIAFESGDLTKTEEMRYCWCFRPRFCTCDSVHLTSFKMVTKEKILGYIRQIGLYHQI